MEKGSQKGHEVGDKGSVLGDKVLDHLGREPVTNLGQMKGIKVRGRDKELSIQKKSWEEQDESM